MQAHICGGEIQQEALVKELGSFALAETLAESLTLEHWRSN
jgi:hypothetical protein